MLHFELPRGVAPLPGEVREASLEEELAVIMAQLMMDTVSPKDAVASIEIMCNRRAQLLR